MLWSSMAMMAIRSEGCFDVLGAGQSRNTGVPGHRQSPWIQDETIAATTIASPQTNPFAKSLRIGNSIVCHITQPPKVQHQHKKPAPSNWGWARAALADAGISDKALVPGYGMVL